MPGGSAVAFQHSLLIGAPPPIILGAFFNPAALRVWWQATRAVTTPRPLGVYAVEWEPTTFQDDLLGRLGGVFHGRVLDYRALTGEFFLADCYWIPPEGDAIGPMALEVTCVPEGALTRLRVAQSGYEESVRWTRYYAVIAPGWKSSLRLLKKYIERGPAAILADRLRSDTPSG
jgi:uncharacterized protein YndB with AHSA1/START domain